MQIITTISTSLSAAKTRLVKALRFGKDDIIERPQIAPYGIDSNPIKGMSALYSETSQKGKGVIIGYINKNQLAEVGEFRTFSTDATGAIKFFIWQKADGTCEIGGDSDNMVRFKPLKDGLADFITAFKLELVEIAAGISSAGGSYTPSTTIDIDIADSKIEEIKTL
jgi:hypothetical protein